MSPRYGTLWNYVFSVPVSVVIVSRDSEHLHFVFRHLGTIHSANHHYFHIHNHLPLILLSWFMVKKSDKFTMSATAVSFIVQDSQNFIHEVVEDINLSLTSRSKLFLCKDIDGI